MKNEIIVKVLISFWFVFQTMTAVSQINENSKKVIVFVCEHGGARSTVASAYFNRLASENNLPYKSIFRAINPDSVISKETKRGLIYDGFDVSTFVPVALTSKDILDNTILISIDCDLTDFNPDLKWNGVPSINKNYVMARNEILKHIKTLMQDLKKDEQSSFKIK